MTYLMRRGRPSASPPLVVALAANRLNLLRQSRAWLLLTLAVLLCSCASVPGSGEQRNITDTSKPLGPPVEQFSISGRLLLKQGQRRDHLRFTWEHTTTGDTLLLSNALGQGVARLTRDAQTSPAASLDLADGKRYLAANWEALSQQVFGQALPLDALPDWLRGANPQWTGLQGKWRIDITEAREHETTAWRQHQLMPRLLQISAEDMVLNIVVESWGDADE